MGAGLFARRRRGLGVPPWVGPTALLALTGFFIGVVVWGQFNPAEVQVEYVDAGRADSFTISEVTAIEGRDLYVVGMPDGRLRAIDGRVEATGCRVRWRPDDDRGRVRNPGNRPGVFEDPCSGALWSMEANAIAGATEPLRTPYIDYRQGPERNGVHAFIEHVNPQH